MPSPWQYSSGKEERRQGKEGGRTEGRKEERKGRHGSGRKRRMSNEGQIGIQEGQGGKEAHTGKRTGRQCGEGRREGEGGRGSTREQLAWIFRGMREAMQDGPRAGGSCL